MGKNRNVLALAAGLALIGTVTAARAHDRPGESGGQVLPFVPARCQVEDWCVLKSTECSIVDLDNPRGFWIGKARFSVVRQAAALCPTGAYGSWQRRVFTGPVEPSDFNSRTHTQPDPAREQALKLCTAARADWMGAAPGCD